MSKEQRAEIVQMKEQQDNDRINELRIQFRDHCAQNGGLDNDYHNELSFTKETAAN